jgi:small-conductance mechanosensitive channel
MPDWHPDQETAPARFPPEPPSLPDGLREALRLLISRAQCTPYTERLTAFLLQPLSGLATRLLGALPLLVVALVAAALTYGAARFVRLFFDGVARGETSLSWLPKDLARPTSVVLQIGLVVAAFVFAAPVVSGDPDGALARVGVVLLVTVGIAVAPLAAAGAVGLMQVYGRRIAIGESVRIGRHRGRVVDVGLLELRMRGEDGADLRVPNLLTLVNATRSYDSRYGRFDVVVDAGVHQPSVRAVLVEAASRVGSEPRAELVELSTEGARYRVSALGAHAAPELGSAVAAALSEAGIELGRPTPPGRPR